MGSTGNVAEQPLFAMNYGEGPLSYVKNSSYQRGVLDVVKPIIEEEIANNLDIEHHISTAAAAAARNAICVADFGCSTGHNSFPAMEIITQAIKLKHESHSSGHRIPELHVFFNDVVSNDFNTLFTSLPSHRNYIAAGIPGDFHGRLLPESSLHFAYSCWSLHWLTQVPKAVTDRDSPTWNKGEIMYTENREEVCGAYLDQFGEDILAFLKCRAVEMARGGLMMLLVPGVPDSWNRETEYTLPSEVNLFGSCLRDMAKMGRFSEEKLDSYNVPSFIATPKQFTTIVEKSQSFRIVKTKVLENPGKYAVRGVAARAQFHRAAHERMLTAHFGTEMIDELFEIYMKKVSASPVLVNPHNDKTIIILVVLKRT